MAELVSFQPTKELFINILTRDISIHDCILDLLDNAVDSYTRNKINEKREVRLNFDKSKVIILDNCGGIEKERLKKEVFRFGATDFSSHLPTIGVYGIGLKRSIFKLGESIIFETDDGKDYCKLKIDIKDWLNKKDPEGKDKWDLELAETSKTRLKNGEKSYTSIKIEQLRYETKETFTPDFETKLKETVKIYYSRFIQDGRVNFYINNEEQRGFKIIVKSSDDFKPVKIEDEYKGVEITIICWLDLKEDEKRARKESGHQGWNIFMNERLVIFDDTSKDTGWLEGGSLLPNFHQIYNQFRGVVFLKTNDPSKLPINTSKNGFNKENEIYHHLLNLMVKVARPFINFLSNKYDEQKEKINKKEDELLATIDKDSRKEEKIIATSIDDTKTEYQSSFTPPMQKTEARPTIPQTTITFKKPKRQVDIIKKILKVYTNKQVGEKIFDYYWESEDLDAE
ncbi:MAG TPA: ATP-binding protein [Candidatus Paceibacterota bacterium]|nr:ATP-binding protein [Candidatus Paceibacterota bacterium]